MFHDCFTKTYLSAEAEHVISCLSVDREIPEQRIVIGTTGGEVKILSDDLRDLRSFHNSANHVSAVFVLTYGAH